MKIYSWGANSYGQLSHGIKSEQSVFPAEAVTDQSMQGIVGLAAGGCHTLALNSAGSVYGCGSNANDQLADCQNNTTALSPIRALQEFRISQITCGWESSFAITDAGTVVAWGSNKYGQLGISKDKVTTTRHPILLNTAPGGVIQVASGLRHTAVLTADREVWVCGQGNKGQLGILTDEGTMPRADVDSLKKVEGLGGVKQVACGQHHTLALTTDGEVWGWGDNRRGQLGRGDPCQPRPRLITTCNPDHHTTVRAGWTHSAILSGGIVRSWGRNNYNQLGHSCGEHLTSSPSQPEGLSSVKQLELGSEHNLALLDNGEVWSWGWNEHGNCGTGGVDNVAVPRRVSVPPDVWLIAAGGGHSLAVVSS